MILRFKPNPGRPGVLTDWEILFSEGFLEDLRLIGGSILESLHPGGEPYVTLPKCGEFELLRAGEHRYGQGRLINEFKAFVLATWQRTRKTVPVEGVDLDAPLPEE